MKIGIIGSGGVGKTLAGGFLKSGHEVKIGTRDASKLNEWMTLTANPKATVGSFADTAKWADIIVLATHGLSTLNAIDLAGKENFKGKIVIDVTNPLDFSGGPPPKMGVTVGNSLGEQIQRHLPEAKVVKAFNIVGANTMVNPKMQDGDPDLLIAGNDDGAKKWANDLAAGWGWNPCIDLGDISNAYWLEAITMAWCAFGFKNNHWTHAFKLLKK